MKPLPLSPTIAVSILVSLGPAARAQSKQFWPEIDTYVHINDHTRFDFVAAKTREGRETTDAEVGPNLDVYFHRLVKLKGIAGPRLDEALSRPLMFRVGYRYMPSSSGTTTNRVFAEVTGRVPLKAFLLASLRNRMEANFVPGEHYWRYRNRISFERTLRIAGYEFVPYARAEFFYDSRYSKFSRTALEIGTVYPFARRFEIEPYYEHQNDTGTSPNRQVNALGVVLSIYFRSH